MDEETESHKRRIRETIRPHKDPDLVPTKAECDREEAR